VTAGNLITFGPVPSRRLGMSLGIDLVVHMIVFTVSVERQLIRLLREVHFLILRI